MATITNPALLTRISLVAGLFAASAAAYAQAYTPSPPDLTTGPCVSSKTEPCDRQPAKTPNIPASADKFPFPDQSPDTPALAVNPDKSANPETPANPDTPTPVPAKQDPAASRYPFPADSPDTPGSSSSSSSSSSDQGDAPPADATPDPSGDGKTALKDAGSSGSTRFSRRKIVVPEDLDHRELEDLSVSKYYISTGNYIAAYSRAQDAIRLYPNDENAHIALAVAADKLDKKLEAVAEYHAYLAAAPDGVQAKSARHALEILEPGNSTKK